jgi:hypothetical protein
LDVGDNKIQTLEGLDTELICLREFYAAKNKLTSLKGI